MRLILSFLILITALIIAIPEAVPESQAAVNRSVSRASPSAGGPFGLGIMLGDPTGITGKYWTSGNTAVTFGVASSWHDTLEVFIDHNWHFTSAFSANAPLIPYIGIGAGLLFDTYERYNRDIYYRDRSTSLALRIPLGIEFLPRTVPIGAFVEITPAVTLSAGMPGRIQAALGARYYF